MYQFGIALVWIGHRRAGARHAPKATSVRTIEPVAAPIQAPLQVTPATVATPAVVAEESRVVPVSPSLQRKVRKVVAPRQQPAGRIDVLMRYTPPRARSQTIAVPSRQPVAPSLTKQLIAERSAETPRASIDGVFRPTSS